MMNEIDKDFYCSADRYRSGGFCLRRGCTCPHNFACSAYHRKRPTPEQYREEYGREVPDDFPVWVLVTDFKPSVLEWELVEYRRYKELVDKLEKIPVKSPSVICACTPFGKPDRDWRP